MSIHRFFVPERDFAGSEVVIKGQDARHIRNVLRLERGDGILLLDGTGKEYRAIIVGMAPGEVVCRAEEEVFRAGEPKVRFTLVQGLPKGDKMDLVVQKATELGVFRILPVTTERSIPRLDPDRARKRVERWRRVAKEAAEQSGRLRVPEIWEIRRFKEALSKLYRDELLLFPWELETSGKLRDVLSANRGRERVAAFIGPEGGFSRNEMELAVSHGAIPVTLGPRILRTETAGLVVLTLVLYEFGEFD